MRLVSISKNGAITKPLYPLYNRRLDFPSIIYAKWA
jgi:hypothetical protein